MIASWLIVFIADDPPPFPPIGQGAWGPLPVRQPVPARCAAADGGGETGASLDKPS